MDSKETAQRIRSLTKEHHEWRQNCINILASENVSSPTVREIVASDFMHRYAEYEGHDVGKRFDEGGRYIIEIEKLGQEMARELFGAEYVDLRPVSGHVASLAAICAFTRPGAVNLELAGTNGGHEWYYFAKNNAVVDYKPEWIPFDVEGWNIDVDAATKKISSSKPSVVVLGSSFYLFPHPTSELRAAADEVGAKIVYDGAHVFGLIAGRSWPNPLDGGADVLTGSTHKTFPGPQKGLVATNNEEGWRRMADSLYPGLLTNHHLMNVAGLVYAMAEFREFGKAYSRQVVLNARALAEALQGLGLDVVAADKGFTKSHQVLVRTERLMQPGAAAAALDRANVICNKMELEGARGLRLGTSEVTRLGMKESEMERVAHFIKDVLVDGKDPKQVASAVTEFMKDYHSIHFSFDEGTNPYEYIEFE